jgi:hypothetical protein
MYSAFGPEDIEIVTTAYEETLLALGLQRGDNPVTREVAQKIIRLAQAGERDSLRLSNANDSGSLGSPTRLDLAGPVGSRRRARC